MPETRDEVWPADQPFRSVEATFTLEPNQRPKCTGYRPLWRFSLKDQGSVLLGLCEMTVLGADCVGAGSSGRTRWHFASEVQGYVEALVRETGEAEVCEGTRRVGTVHRLRLVR